FDIQTGIKNRAAFEKEMEQYANNNKNAAIVMFDLNYLKRTNDLYGHDAGDNLIFNAAKAIKECFIGIGKTYRIGGDEFCVICENSKKEQIDCT
ncbi:GGDEF domain-containing protein, partial [Mycobacteroides abscessus subsp. massiliense]|uniref:GGDEF domain-containing protein n=1 Tax=Mycobacteroides abscessus TaxID=36809 RepID=UPI003CF25636